MSEYAAGKRRSKRNRSLAFDISRISGQSPRPKFKKKGSGGRMESATNRDASMRDLSGTINNPNASTSATSRAAQHSAQLERDLPREEDQVIRNMVYESVNEARLGLNSLVQESIGREMEKVYSVVNKLNEAVARLSIEGRGGSSNQMNQTIPPAHTGSGPTPSYGDGNLNIRRNTVTPSISNGQQGIKVERFGLNFSGKPNTLSVEDFIYRLEYFQRHYRLEWDDILNEFHILVSGPAYEWFWLQQKTNNVSNWESLKHALIERFKTRRTCFEEMRDLLERKQLPGETIDSFFHDVNLMRSKLERPVSEYEMISLVKKNLRKSLSSIVYSMPVSSLEQLRVECLEIERTFFKKDPIPHPVPLNNRPIRVSEIQDEPIVFENFEEPDDLAEVSAITTQLKCWNCQIAGHGFRDCSSSQRNLFCFKCGRQNTITPKCANCSTGNSRKNMVAAGNHRSSENPALANQSNK